MKTGEFNVFPKPPRPVSEEEKSKICSEVANMYRADISTAWVIGCGGFVVASSLSLGIIVIGIPGTQIPSGCALIPSIPLGIGLGLLTKYQLQKQVLNRRERELQRRLHQLSMEREREVNDRASRLTKELRRTLEEAPAILEAITKTLSATEERLEVVEDDFRANAFGPFWDGIEEISKDLTLLHRRVTVYREQVTGYKYTLRNETHNFPDFPIELEDLPNPEAVIIKLKEMIRTGETNFQFASILEQRKSRSSMLDQLKSLNYLREEFISFATELTRDEE